MQHLYTALSVFHQDVGKIIKGSKAQYGLYADLATVLATVSPSLAANGLVIHQTFQPWDGNGTILRTTLGHVSGESITSDLLMPSADGQRNALHAFGAATTYLRRYALLSILNLAAEDDDGDSFSRDKAVPKTTSAAKPTAKIQVPIIQEAPSAASAAADALTTEEKAELVAAVTDLPAGKRKDLIEAFRSEFSLPADVKVSDYIRNSSHSAFIRKHLHGAVLA